MSDLVGNPEDRFSHNEAQIKGFSMEQCLKKLQMEWPIVKSQTAPLGTVCSGSALFAQTCLSENLRSITIDKKH